MRKNPPNPDGTEVVAGCLAALLIFALFALIVLFAWNVGVCAIIAGAPAINYVEALAVTFGLMILGSLFRRV